MGVGAVWSASLTPPLGSAFSSFMCFHLIEQSCALKVKIVMKALKVVAIFYYINYIIN